MDVRKFVYGGLLVTAMTFVSMPAVAGVVLIPTEGSRIYGYADSLQGCEDDLLGEGIVGEGEWIYSLDSLANPSVLAEDDPIDSTDDPLLLDGLSSFATARASLTDAGGWSGPPDSNDAFQLFVNNQATQDPGSIGPYGWGYSVAYLLVTYDTAPVGDSDYGDPMTVSIDFSLAEELYADGYYDEYFLDMGCALGTGLVDYDPVNSGDFGQFDKYETWGSNGYSYEPVQYSDSLVYSGVIGEQVQVQIALRSFSYSFWGYAWTEATLDPTVQSTAQATMQDLTTQAAPSGAPGKKASGGLDSTPYTSVRAIVTALAPVFGPNQYSKTKGEPDMYAGTFSARAGQGELLVKNGDMDGGNKVIGAVIKLNGEEILGPPDLSQNGYKLKVPVNLDWENSISIELRGQPGSYLSLQVVQ